MKRKSPFSSRPCQSWSRSLDPLEKPSERMTGLMSCLRFSGL
ncbi:hypothetical protein [Streptomyces sp. NPDC058751]